MRREHEQALAAAAAAFKRRNLSASRSDAVLRVARRLLARVSRRSLARVTRRDVETFLAGRAAEGLSRATLAHDFHALHVFFVALVDHDLLAAAPTEGMVVRRPAPPPQLLLSAAAVRCLLASASERARRWPGPVGHALVLRDRALLELLYATGVRSSEACAARVLDLDREGATLLVRSAKRGRWRRVPLPARALAHLAAYLREARPVLLRGRPDPGHLLVTCRGTRVSHSLAHRIVRDVARAAGLRAYPHALRRAIATHLVRAQVPVPAVQALLGHRRLATTATYVAVDREDLRRSVELLERGRAT